MAHPLEASSPRDGFAVVARARGSKDDRESVRCSRPSRRIAEPVVGREFARPVDDAPQDEVGNLRMPRVASTLHVFATSRSSLKHAAHFCIAASP
jgi:hypothetical protein